MTEEEAIFKSQQLDIIYAQSGILYEIIPDAPWSNKDPRQNHGPHADGTIGSANSKSTDHVTNHMKKLSLNQFATGWAMASSLLAKSSAVHSLHRRIRSIANSLERIGGKVEIITASMGIITTVTRKRTIRITTSPITMLVRVRKKSGRSSFHVSCVKMITLPIYSLI
jgi:hypothetical protein